MSIVSVSVSVNAGSIISVSVIVSVTEISLLPTEGHITDCLSVRLHDCLVPDKPVLTQQRKDPESTKLTGR